jgi:hypothetical protein
MDQNDSFQDKDTSQFDVNIPSLQSINLFQSGGSNNYFSVLDSSESTNKTFNCKQYKYNIKLNNKIDKFISTNTRIVNLFNQLYEFIKSKCSERDKVRVIFDHKDLEYPISCSLINFSEFSAQLMIDLIERVVQSRKTVTVDEKLKLIVTIAEVPVGSGLSIENHFTINRNCIINIVNEDNLCALRATLVAIDYLNRNNNNKKEFFISSSKYDSLVKKYQNLIGLEDKPCTIAEIKKIEMYFRDYQIAVVN